MIPRTIFNGMDELQNLFVRNKIIQIEKINVKQFANLEWRRELNQKTCEIVKLSKGFFVCFN